MWAATPPFCIPVHPHPGILPSRGFCKCQWHKPSEGPAQLAQLSERALLHTQTPATTGQLRPEHHPPSLPHPASQHPAISSPETAPGSTDPSSHHQHHPPSDLSGPQKHHSSLLTKHHLLSWLLSFRDVLHTAKVRRQSTSSPSPAGKGRMQHLRKVIKGAS